MFSAKYVPRNLKDLVYLLNDSSVSLRDIDVRHVHDLGFVFLGAERSDWDGLKHWDVSNVTNMASMFAYSNIGNVDLSGWDVSSVKDMSGMFKETSFNGDISSWDVSNVEDMNTMFYRSMFNGDISKWRPVSVVDIDEMFFDSGFGVDISGWVMPKVRFMSNVFDGCPLSYRVPVWYVVEEV